MPGEGATTGTSQHARVHARASASAADSCAPAMDEDQASAGAQSAPTALLHPRNAEVTLALSRSMHLSGADPAQSPAGRAIAIAWRARPAGHSGALLLLPHRDSDAARAPPI